MSFEEFKEKILSIMRKSGETSKVSFSYDEEKGLYHAVLSNGVRFSSNANHLRIVVRWGKHQAIVGQGL